LHLIKMAGSASGDGPAIKPLATDASAAVQGDDSTSPSTPQSNVAFSSFQAINRVNGGQSESGRQSRDASARGTPQADAPGPNLKSSEAASSNVAKASAQLEQFESAGNYGTRSRRGGKERLNYAEDQDADFDFTSAATTTTYKKGASAAAANAQSTPDSKRAKESAQPVTTNGAHSSANNQTIAKDPAPGATSTATNPKKRKAAGTATPTNLASTPPVSAALSAANMRKQLPSSLARETNMLSFSRSKACLNNKGELVADDGTKLNINGKRLARIPFHGSLPCLAHFAEVRSPVPRNNRFCLGWTIV
jgi:hypothetical protein